MDPHATAGRIVHMYPLNGEYEGPIAAIVNRETTPEGMAELTVFGLHGARVIEKVQYSEEPKIGYWSWPPHQKETETPVESSQ